MQRSEKVDAYIKKAQPFAQPILETIREWVEMACPDAEEQMKWSFPHFTYKGANLCSMAAFKQHCAFSFWLAAEMNDPAGIFKEGDARDSMGNLGKIRKPDDLPSQEIMHAYLIHAMELIEMGVKLKKNPANEKPPVQVPTDLSELLSSNPAAKSTFNGFTESCKREYVDWITEAKTAPTREKRLMQTIDWLNEGKKRNWKYEKAQ